MYGMFYVAVIFPVVGKHATNVTSQSWALISIQEKISAER